MCALWPFWSDEVGDQSPLCLVREEVQMSRLVFDIETDGLIETMKTIHCLVTLDVDTKEERVYIHPETNYVVDGSELEVLPLDQGLAELAEAEALIGHNIIAFDIPAILHLYPDWRFHGNFYDTQVVGRLVYPDIKTEDEALAKRHPSFPHRLRGRHKLEAWGWRIGKHKSDYGIDRTDWTVFDLQMLEYCVQDVRVTALLCEHLVKKKPSQHAVDLEHRFSCILAAQERAGFGFDREGAMELLRELQTRRAELQDELKTLFPPRVEVSFTPKRKLRREKEVPFNPNSRQQIAWHLTEKYGWKPKDYTASGQVKIDEGVLASIEYPEAKQLAESLTIQKRIASLDEGKGSWLKSLGEDGRIHGRVVSIGTPHTRCKHFSPNLAQVTKVCPTCGVKPCRTFGEGKAHSPYGWECRNLFVARDGYLIVGADCAGSQLRSLAHYLEPYDDGNYIKVVTEGDPHTANQEAAGLSTRSQAKNFIYAYLFGQADTTRGYSFCGVPLSEPKEVAAAAGKRLAEQFERNLPGLSDLKAKLKVAAKKGFVFTLHGGRIPIPSYRVALNYLLSAAEAVIMKQATVVLETGLRSAGIIHGRDYYHVAHVHDEFQLEVVENLAEQVGEASVAAVRAAGTSLNFRCPLSAEYKVGPSWAYTH